MDIEEKEKKTPNKVLNLISYVSILEVHSSGHCPLWHTQRLQMSSLSAFDSDHLLLGTKHRLQQFGILNKMTVEVNLFLNTSEKEKMRKLKKKNKQTKQQHKKKKPPPKNPKLYKGISGHKRATKW